MLKDNIHCLLNRNFVKKLKQMAVENDMSMITLSKELSKHEKPFKQLFKKDDKKNYWIKI